jgi:competence protein ComEA
MGVGLGIKTKIDAPKTNLTRISITPTVSQVNSKVVFDISGEVLKPGVYTLSSGSRISEALIVAGGLAVNADREWVEQNINRARKIGDGEKIYIPKKNNQETKNNFSERDFLRSQTNSNNQIKNTKQENVLGAQSGGVININSATVEELDKLDGVGPAIAQKIIDYRQKNNGFRDINEIKLVSGVGDKMYEVIKEKIGI